MNVERFAGENVIFQKMNAELQQNIQRMKMHQSQSMQIAERQKERDAAAAFGKVIPFGQGDFISN